MLDAYLRKGARLPTEAGDGRRVIEDAITSTFFSPLKFMSPRDAGKILSWLTGSPRDMETNVHSLQLWPRFAADDKSANEYTIEPDLVLDGTVDDQPFRWIIEVKWDAVLLRQQIEDQVRICTKDLKGWHHISLIKSAELAAFEAHTTIMQWNQVLSILQDVLRSNAADGASLVWCRDAIGFLEKLGVGTFKGFGLLNLAPAPIEEMDLSVWRGLPVDHLIEVTPVRFSMR